MIKKILFPVDFSPACAAMGAYVRSVATIFQARVSLLHVAHLESRDAFEIYVRPAPEIEEERRSLAHQRLNAFLQTEFPTPGSERFLAFGDAADEIRRVVHEYTFDLIMMPTHTGRFRRMLLGSTTAKVLTDATCPVLTTEHAETMAPRPLTNRRWLCGISLNDDSERVLRAAAEAAEVTGAQLSMTHAIQVGHLSAPKALGREEEVDFPEARDVRERAERVQRAVGCDAPLQIIAGPSVKEALVEAIRRSGTDVFMIGRRGQHDLAYQIARDSPVPVLSI